MKRKNLIIVFSILSFFFLASYFSPQLIKAQTNLVTVETNFEFKEKVTIGDETVDPPEESLLVVNGKGEFSKTVSGGEAIFDDDFVTLGYVDSITHWAEGSDDISNINTGNVGIGTDIPGEKLHVNGNILANAIYYTSDIRFKDNIYTLSNSLDKISSLNPVSFTWKENDQESLGFIAQELEEVLPSLVKTSGESGYKSIQYSNLTALLTAGIKEQQKKIDKLEVEVEILKLQVSNLLNN